MIWAMFLVFVVIFIWAMPLEKKIIFSMFWAMPSARATTGSLCSVAFGEPSPAYPYRIFFVLGVNWFLIELFLGDAFGPGYSGLAYARLLLRNEPSPAYPYRGNN